MSAVFTNLGHVVAGLDFSFGMLLEANRRAPGYYLQGDMTRLPFAAESFDAVWMSASLLHLPRDLAPGVLAGVREYSNRRGCCISVSKKGRVSSGSSARGNVSSPCLGVDEVGGLLLQAGYQIEWQWVEPTKKQDWINSLALRK